VQGLPGAECTMHYCIVTARRCASAGISYGSVIVRLCVCLSHAGIVSKRLQRCIMCYALPSWSSASLDLSYAVF